jgi:asparagine N-glycosylation enzyme membrane subunit Stt3
MNSPVFLDLGITALAILALLVLIEFFSPAARVYSQPLDLPSGFSERQGTNPEERQMIDDAFDRKIEAVESGELDPDWRRTRLHGPLLVAVLPGLIIGIAVGSWKSPAFFSVATLSALAIWGVVLPLELVLFLLGLGAAYSIKVKYVQLSRT